MSENIKEKLEEFSKSENFNIDYLYNLISRELTLLYISNGFDTLKDFKSILIYIQKYIVIIQI